MAGPPLRPLYQILKPDPKQPYDKERNWRTLRDFLKRGLIPIRERFSQYENNGGQAIAGTAATVEFDTNGTNENTSIFVYASNELTVNFTGTVLVTVRVSVQSDDDSGDYAGEIWLEKNSVEVAGSKAYVG